MIKTGNGGVINVLDKRMPLIGQEIYRLWENELHVDKVFAIAARGFILESYKSTKENYSWCELSEKDKTWFDNFNDAAETLLSAYSDDYELVKHEDTWYEVMPL